MTGAPTRSAGTPQGILVILAGFLPILAIVALTPTVPPMVRHFARTAGASTLVPLVVTAPGLMIALLSPMMGWIADRYGRTRLLFWATLAYGFVGMAPYFLSSLLAIFISRLALGLCEAAILTVTNTLIADYYPEAGRRNWLMAQALAGPVFGVSVLMGSGTLANYDWHWPFLIYAVAIPMAGAMTIWLFEPLRRHDPAIVGAEPFPWHHVLGCGFITLLGASLYYVYIVQIGLAFASIGVDQADRIGMLVGLANIGVFAGGAAFKPLSMRLGVTGQVAAFMGFLGVGMMGIGFARHAETMTFFAVVQQFGAGLLVPTLVLWAMTGVPAHHRGRAMGIWSACFFLGQFTSPLAVSLVRLNGTSIGGAFACLGALALAVACISLMRSGLRVRSAAP